MANATKTTVSTEKSKQDIEKLLTRYGATGFVHGWSEGYETLIFELMGRRYRFSFRTPTVQDVQFDSSGRLRTQAQTHLALKQAQRTRWRELLLGIKAKLVLVDAGIVTMESEFLANIVLPDNSTFGEWAAPYLRHVYLEGKMPPMLPRGDE